jgi:hypothetical protein
MTVTEIMDQGTSKARHPFLHLKLSLLLIDTEGGGSGQPRSSVPGPSTSRNRVWPPRPT